MKTKITIFSLVCFYLLFSGTVICETISPTELIVDNGVYYRKYSDTPYTGSVEGQGHYYTYEKGGYIDGKKAGVWRYYHLSNQLWTKGTFKNGIADGSWEWYLSDGKPWSRGFYEDGKETGLWKFFYDNGNLRSKGIYKDGLLHGFREKYSKSGNLEIKEYWNMGKKVD
ncbi:MAG: hypothetical protein CL568_07605 [Alphaproteobacteria bacterium]|mgnify:FL=1|jgi:antitoxin component YwqK of YwqJK toxin-antitoxin module|nr:hypothetical protein [Alphaproteobacteria bacterium]PPR12419.1 MAG: hypothetical protein CFH42_02242 [Alphaproteobacteria bacterium MarineAlpha12_Bin1]|tara:strand:- start:2429 stop:2935 length:507 start_codon:yes stop_codon:yes gene_type:complete